MTIVLPRTDPNAGTKGMSAFLVEKDVPGFLVGTLTKYPLERMYRDVRITPIDEGTNQIQRLVIACEAVR